MTLKQRTVRLPAPITVEIGGQSITSAEVVLTAPGKQHIKLQKKIERFLLQGATAFAKKKVAELGKQGAREFGRQQSANADHAAEYPGRVVCQLLRDNIPAADFSAFVALVRSALTDAPGLARLSDGSPLTPAVWSTVDQTCGASSVEEICGAFADFVMPRDMAQTG